MLLFPSKGFMKGTGEVTCSSCAPDDVELGLLDTAPG